MTTQNIKQNGANNEKNISYTFNISHIINWMC